MKVVWSTQPESALGRIDRLLRANPDEMKCIIMTQKELNELNELMQLRLVEMSYSVYGIQIKVENN